MNISGHAAIVTGGASGLGAATARRLAAQGAKVAVLDRNEAAAKAVAAEIDGIGIACDVASAESAQAAVEAANQAHGVARMCVNCAGIGPAARVVGRDGPMPLDAFQKVIDVNLVGTFNVTRLVAAAMAAGEPVNDTGERGVIVFTASVAGYEGQIGQAAYSASKGGIIGMTLPIARELARSGVRIMTIAPGLMKTPLLASLPEDVQESLGRSVPFPARLGDPDEFAALVQQIVENAMLNGETIRLDGAIRMAPK